MVDIDKATINKIKIVSLFDSIITTAKSLGSTKEFIADCDNIRSIVITSLSSDEKVMYYESTRVVK